MLLIVLIRGQRVYFIDEVVVFCYLDDWLEVYCNAGSKFDTSLMIIFWIFEGVVPRNRVAAVDVCSFVSTAYFISCACDKASLSK